jgi:predicted TPR repeat methyltransferase
MAGLPQPQAADVIGARLQQAVQALQGDDTEGAEGALKWVLAAQPGHPDALHFLGVLRHRQGLADEAVGLIRRAIDAAPAQPGMWVNLCNVLHESGQSEEAVAACRAALDLDPAAAQTWCNLGTVQHALGRTVEACQAWERATALAPGLAEAWYGLSRALIELGRVHQGLIANSRAVTLSPRNLLGREQVLRALVLLGEHAEAARLYRDWLAQDPDNPVVRHQLAAIDAAAPEIPPRASDGYIESVFDSFAPQFDAKLQGLGYRAPQLVARALSARVGAAIASLDIADLGCGTGLCGPGVKPLAKRLVGCDLSVGMLVQARRGGQYDALFKVELVHFLQHEPRQFDALVSADTLCYFGNLDEVSAAAATALRPGGGFVFTVEALEPEPGDHRLRPTGRYAHSRAHIHEALQRAGLVLEACESDVLRQEAGLPVVGWVVTAGLPGLVAR